MQNSLNAARRTAFRTVVCQLLATLALALLFWLLGPRHALAAGVGGLAATLGSALMAWRALGAGLNGAGVNGAGMALMRLLGGMALKWLVVVAVLYWGLALVRLPPLPLLIGLALALLLSLSNLKANPKVAT